MAITAEISSTDRTEYFAVDSCRFQRQLNGRGSLSATLMDRPGGNGSPSGFRPAWGNTVTILEDGTKRFAGRINTVTEKRVPGLGGASDHYLRFEISARDFSYICDRRLVTGSWENYTFYNLILRIWADYLAGEGITVSNVQNDSPPLTISERIDANFETVTQVFNKISAITGRMWYIDFDKDLHFGDFVTGDAPFDITDTSDNWFDLSVTHSDEDYRNRQYVRTEYRTASTYTDTLHGTAAGTQLVYLTFPCSDVQTPIVTLNGTPQTCAEISNATGETLYDWYFLKGGTAFQNFADIDHPGGVKIYPGDTLVVEYVPMHANIAMAEDVNEQAERAAIEGTSGIYEAIEEQRNIATYEALLAIAQGRLRQYGSDAIRVQFSTDESGLEPGQRMDLAGITFHELTHGSPASTEFLIEAVDYEWRAARPDFFRHTVRLTSQEPFMRPPSFMEKLVEMARIGPDPVAVLYGQPGSVAQAEPIAYLW